MAAILELGVHPHHIFRARDLGYYIQVVPHHHDILCLSVCHDWLKARDNTFACEKHLFFKVSQIRCSIYQENLSFAEYSLAGQESVGPLVGDSEALPLRWGNLNVWLLNNLYDRVYGGCA